MRTVKFPIVEVGGAFKEYEFDKVQPSRKIEKVSQNVDMFR